MTQSLQPGRIAVVSGGRSTERERSLMSGPAALESLERASDERTLAAGPGRTALRERGTRHR